MKRHPLHPSPRSSTTTSSSASPGLSLKRTTLRALTAADLGEAAGASSLQCGLSCCLTVGPACKTLTLK